MICWNDLPFTTREALSTFLAIGCWAILYFPVQGLRIRPIWFSINDSEISQTFTYDEFISGVEMGVLSFCVPSLVFILWFAPQYKSFIYKGKPIALYAIWVWTWVNLLACGFTEALTNLAKHLGQKPRPDFIDRCFGGRQNIPANISANPFTLISSDICPFPGGSKMAKDGRLSYFSGHSSISMVGHSSIYINLFYLCIYYLFALCWCM